MCSSVEEWMELLDWKAKKALDDLKKTSKY
jgi:hypothetical protein